MKFWERDGACGTMDDDGHVPDSEEVTEAEYDAYVASLPAVPEIDHKDKFSKLLSADDKIDYIAKHLKFV